MSFDINISNASKTLKQFIKAHGGDVKHSEILELLAGICGFSSYRALKACTKEPGVDDALSQAENASHSPRSENAAASRALEDANKVVFRSTAVDWQLADNPDISLAEVPASKRTPYDVIFEQQGSQFRLLLKPVGTHLDNFEGRAVLDCLVEINEGVPCLHLTNDPADTMLVSVFATGEGLLLRPNEELVRARQASLSGAFQSLLRNACENSSDRDSAFVALMDTAKKYAVTAESED